MKIGKNNKQIYKSKLLSGSSKLENGDKVEQFVLMARNKFRKQLVSVEKLQ